MEAYKQEFIKFMVESDVLKFGSFTLKSGRQSPFFMSAGAYVTGYQLKKLGEYYAQAIHDNFGDDFDVLFGPAYKGIPLAVVTAIAYHELYGKEVKYCCDRKEAKDHGADKGNLLGYEPQDGDRVIITAYRDHSVEVEDFGRGVPLDWNEREQKYNWELVYCELYAGGKYNNNDEGAVYKYSLGLNGLGACATQYSSKYFHVKSYKGDTVGHKAICVIPTTRTGKITLEVTKANGDVKIRDIKAYYAK